MRGLRAIFVFVVAAIAVAACGSSGNSGAKASPQLPVASTLPAGQSALDCGTLRLGAGSVELVAGRQDAALCFAASFAECKQARIDYTKHGVDTGEEHVFAVVKTSTGCRIDDEYRNYSPVRALNKSATYQCTGLQVVGKGVLVHACGAAGDVAIPAVGTR